MVDSLQIRVKDKNYMRLWALKRGKDTLDDVITKLFKTIRKLKKQVRENK